MSLLNARNEIDGGRKEEMNHADCARSFFNESHHVTKEKFFRVCCHTWLEDFIHGADSANSVTHELLWNTLKRIYVSSKRPGDCPSIIAWILPDLPQASLTDPNAIDYQYVGTDRKYKECLMNFWKELFKASEDGSSSASENYENDNKSKRATKRRRLGSSRFASLGFKNLLKGHYKLPAIYLMISLYKEIGFATEWSKLCDLAHDLPSIFKTFAENDILAGLALVGLADIGTGRLLTGLSAPVLITEYFSGIDSYGPSILRILHDATSLNLYNLRAAVCREILDHLETFYDNSCEDFKANTINACAVCIDQEHPERFIDDLENKQEQPRGKRRQRMNGAMTRQCIPGRFSSPGFPLLVHIQICLLRHEVERAAELTRRMDSSPGLNDEVRDDAWFNIWRYLLGEGILFLDGNLDTPGYLKKRDFLYTYMACQVSQKAKIAMTDFYQEVANRICEHEDSSLEEKQYVILACQQTVLRLLLKIRGLGINTILEFVKETKWPVEIHGQKSEKDLKVWSANFLLQKREIPSSLVDERTGLIDLFKRFESVSETPSALNLDSSLTPTKTKSPSDPIEGSTREKKFHERESSLSRDDYRIKPATPEQFHGLSRHVSVAINNSSVPNTFHEENESDQHFELDDDDGDDEVVILDDDDDDDEALVVENEETEEGLEIEDDNDEEDEISESHDYLSEEDKKLEHSDDEGDYTSDVYLDEEITGFDEDREHYQDEGGSEFSHGDEGETTSGQEKIIESDNDIDDTHRQSEDESSNDDFAENEKNACDESDDLEINPEDVEYDDADRVDNSNNFKAGGLQGSSIASHGEDRPIDRNLENNRVLGIDICKDNSDSVASHEDISVEKDGGRSSKSGMNFVEIENSQIMETASNKHESENVRADDSDGTGNEHHHLHKVHNHRTKVAAMGVEFGDTTEEEDGNDRFKANSTAQADRRADTLKSGVGYASQVEDGYEPEDTHGYTEEEVSEAIHTEDEEDENTVRQKPPLSDTDTSQQAGHTSETNNEDFTRLLSGKPEDTVRNADRQNSIEPTSDDMDMADEHTEQEEDVAAEFSELEENPDGSFESQKRSSESTQAKTLLEFAQKAQNKDNWGQLKDTESISEDVDSKRNETQTVEQASVEYGLLAQKPEFSKNCALSFDADDEKYATEGCKSLETEEEDTEKDGVEISPQDGVSKADGSSVDGIHNDEGKDSKEGHDENNAGCDESIQSEIQQKDLDGGKKLTSVENEHDNIAPTIGHEDKSDALSDVNTIVPVQKSDGGETIFPVVKTGSEVKGNNDNDCKFDFVEGKTDEEILKHDKASTKKENIEGDTTGGSIIEEVPNEDVEVNELSDVRENASTATEPERDEQRNENKNLLLERKQTTDHDPASTCNKTTAPECEDGDIKSDSMPSGDNCEILNDEAAAIVVDTKIDKGGARSVAETSLGAANDKRSPGESNCQNSQGSMLIDDACAGEKSSLSDNGASSFVVNPLPRTKYDNTCSDIEKEESKTDDEVVSIDDRGTRGAGKIDNTNPANEEGCIDSTAIPVAKEDSVTAENLQNESQDNTVIRLVKETDDTVEAKPHFEDTDSRSIKHHCDSQTEDIAGNKVDGVEIKQTEVAMDVENEFDAVGSLMEKSVDSKESARVRQSEAHMPDDELESTGAMKDTVFSHSEEVLEIHDSAKKERSDIPKFIGGDVEQQPSKSTRRSGRKRSYQYTTSEGDGDSLGDESEKNGDGGSVISGASAISEIFRTGGGNNKKQHADDDAGVSSSFLSRPQKETETDNDITKTIQKNGEDVGSVGNKSILSVDRNSVQSETSGEKRKPSTRSSTRVSTRSASNREKNSATLASATRNPRGGLPPRPPKETRKALAGRVTRSKKKTEDDLSAQTITSTRSTRSSTRNVSSGNKASTQRRSKDTSIENDDDVDGDASVHTTASMRSTRSSTRKMLSNAKAPKQKIKETSIDKDHDNASVQTTTSVRSTRSSTRKTSSGPRNSKRKAKQMSNDDDDDHASVLTTISVRSTRSVTRKLSTDVTKRTGEANEDGISYSSWTVKMLQRELTKRKISFPSKSRKKELIEKLISDDEA